MTTSGASVAFKSSTFDAVEALAGGTSANSVTSTTTCSPATPTESNLVAYEAVAASDPVELVSLDLVFKMRQKRRKELPRRYHTPSPLT